MRIVCIDFETANNSDASICAAGVAVFVDGRLEETREWLVRPPKGHGFFMFTYVHKLTWFDVADAPEFPAIAAELLPMLQAADVVVAHNAAFDLRKLRGTLAHFGMKCPNLPHACTWKLAKRVWQGMPDYQLSTLAAHVGHSFEHHDAREDAEACGRVLLAMMSEMGVETPAELLTSKTQEIVQ